MESTSVAICCKDKSENCQCSNKCTESCRQVFTEDFTIATILMVAYLIETLVQIFLIVNCYRSLYIPGASNWLWILFIGWLVSSLLVTIISIIWTFRGLDFSGKVCGQLLCYLMHFLLLGFLWRYLKIALAYEKADVDEFFKLRKVQIYIQAFPLLTIHLAYLISPAQTYDNAVAWMVAGELCSSIISLSLHPLLKPKRDFFNETSDHKYKPQLTLEMNVTIRIFFLISRVIVVGLLVSLTRYWCLVVLLVHLLISCAWTLLMSTVFTNTKLTKPNDQWDEMQQNKCLSSTSIASKDRPVLRDVKKLVISSYALFWDVNSSIVGGMDLRCLSLPVLLVLVENVAILIFHLRQCQTTIFFFVVSGTCLLCGLLLLIAVTTWNKWSISSPSHSLCTSKDIFYQPKRLPVVDPTDAKLGREHVPTSLINSSIDFTNFCDQTQANKGKGSVSKVQDDGNETRSLEGVTSSNAPATTISTNTNTYERINETLMTVKMHKVSLPNQSEIKSNICTPLSQHDPKTEMCSKPRENTLGSTSSRNTNTVSDLTSQKCIEDQILTSNNNTIHLKTIKDDNEAYQINQTSPLVIRKASKIVLNTPKHRIAPDPNQNRYQCKLEDKCGGESDNNIYEKLIEDAYGILICEGEPSQKTERFINHDSSSNLFRFHTRKKLKVLCAKCLQNHDPLLSDCCLDKHIIRSQNLVELNREPNLPNPVLYVPRAFDSPNVYSETTEYPTDTEFTCPLNELNEGDELSISTHLSTIHNVTYANLPIQCQSHFNHIFNSAIFPTTELRKEFTGLEYVKAWLLMNDDMAMGPSSNRNSNNKINSLNRNNKRLQRSRLSSRPQSVACRKSHSAFYMMKFKPPPKQKQHPGFETLSKSNCSRTVENVPIPNSKLHYALHCNHYLVNDFRLSQSDLVETVV